MKNIHEIIRKHTIGDGHEIVIDLKKSHGSYIVDAVTNKKYLDCSSQYASLPLGWNHPKLVEKILSFTPYVLHKVANSDFYTEAKVEFVQTFAEITPDFKHLFFIEGGTLGVENALKAAFDWKMKKIKSPTKCNRLDVIHLKQAFHGRSGYCLSITNTLPNKTDLFPKFNWTRIENPKITFPMVEGETIESEDYSLFQAEESLKSFNVAAIILETIQGEGGDNHFSPRYFQELRLLADKYEAMLILDEVQTGVGLTGKMWAYEHSGIIPDMISFGKKTQVCGFASTHRIDEIPDNVFKVSSRINSTWGGNIVDMMRFKYIAEIIKEDNLLKNVQNVGNYFLHLLKEIKNISNVRGKGFMIAFDLETPEDRDATLNKISNEMTVLSCGERSIRLRPHLAFSKEEAFEAVEIIKNAV